MQTSKFHVIDAACFRQPICQLHAIWNCPVQPQHCMIFWCKSHHFLWVGLALITRVKSKLRAEWRIRQRVASSVICNASIFSTYFTTNRRCCRNLCQDAIIASEFSTRISCVHDTFHSTKDSGTWANGTKITLESFQRRKSNETKIIKNSVFLARLLSFSGCSGKRFSICHWK